MSSISLLIFSYNSADVIENNLKAINLAIRFSKLKDFEILLIDNNSTDDTIQIANEYAYKNNLKINIQINQIQGLVFSRILGIKKASNEWIAFIDDDNFISPNWLDELFKIIDDYIPDVIGGSTIAISDVDFPVWFNKNMKTYACGQHYDDDGFLYNPLESLWGAGLVAKRSLLEEAVTRMDFILTGRIGNKLMAGEDTELCYRLRLLGAKFYYSNNLKINHFMRPKRLVKSQLNKTLEGFGYATVYKEVYEAILLNKRIGWFFYKIFYSLAAGVFKLIFNFSFSSLKFTFVRLITLNERIKYYKLVKSTFQ